MKKQISEKGYLQIISLFTQIIFVFFSVFFSVYVYEMAQDLNFVMYYTLFQTVMSVLFDFVISRFASEKVLRLLYKLSFVMALISTALVFTISVDRLYMVFVTQLFYALTHAFYYFPYEVATMDKNSKKQMKKFVGVSALLTLAAGVLSPFLSGFIIDYVSYYVLFGIILACAAVCFVLSFKVKTLCKIDYKASYRQYFKITHSYKSIRMGLVGYGLFKFSQDGLIDILLPVLIFMKTGGNFSVGLYSALATLLAGIVLMIYISFVKDKVVAMWISTVFLIAVSILLIFWNSLVAFFIYYFIKRIVKEILKNGIYENVFTFSNGTIAEPFKVEQRLTYCLYRLVFTVLSYGLALIIYNFVRSEISISLILVSLSVFQILSTYLVLKSEKIRKTEIEAKSNEDQTQLENLIKDN